MNTELLKKISENLGFEFDAQDSQDWGIINADADRIEEFIDYFERNSELPATIKISLFELIIASFNDSITNNAHPHLLSLLRDFLKKTSGNELYTDTLHYWKNLPDNEEFQIQKFL